MRVWLRRVGIGAVFAAFAAAATAGPASGDSALTEALAVLKREKVDTIISDILMTWSNRSKSGILLSGLRTPTLS